MSSQEYRIIFVHNDLPRESRVCAMLQSAEPGQPLFEVRSAKVLPNALERLDFADADGGLLDLSGCQSKDLKALANFRSRIHPRPVVVLISKADKLLGKQAVGMGAVDFLVKETLSPELLRTTLRCGIELSRAQDAARQAEGRFEELFENTKDILFVVDLQGQVTSVNKAAEHVLGWPRNDVLKKSLKDFVAPEHVGLCARMMERILTEEHVPHFEVAMLRSDGRRVLLEASVRVIRSNGIERAIQGVARDVTERRQLENQLRQVQKLEAIGRLSGGLAHDFNNLLCVISGHTEILAANKQLTEEAARSLAQIKKAADSAASLTRQLLAFSRKQVFHPRTMDLNAIVLETERLLSRLIGEHIEFFTTLDPALGYVNVDPVQIEQVLVNLVLNARDAMPQGGKLIIETSNLVLEENREDKHFLIPGGQYVLLAVTDTGCGMDEKTQSRLFEPFYTTKELGKGTGLGLATVYGIVKQSGGFVWVYSELGRGTTFKVYLPRIEKGSEPFHAVKKTAEARKGTETILLVEDAGPLRALAREFLEGAGYTVLEAANGKQAGSIARAFAGPIHLLLTDVVMPGLGGKELADQLAPLRPAMKVLFMSGYPDDAIVQSGKLVTGVSLLEKPFTRDILWQRVRQVLDQENSTTSPAREPNSSPRGKGGSIEAT